MPESAYGPTNNCVGIAHRLLSRGHRVVFAADQTWRGRLSPLGIEEELIDLAPPSPSASQQSAGQFWKDYIGAIAPHFATSTTEQLTGVIRPIWEELVAGAKYVEPQLRSVIGRVRPDVIVEDNVVGFPALMTAGVPFVRIVSCNPLEIPGDAIAPAFSGLAASATSHFGTFREAYRESHVDLWSDFNEWFRAQGAPDLAPMEFIGPGDVNVYVYPEELDYVGDRPLGSTWHRVESCVRETEEPVELPSEFTDGRRPLIYFSLGSLGSADVALMRRVIDALADQPYHIIVSKGPRHDEIELADNMWGTEFLPQTTLLPRVDLVITHGGNNTVTECMHFGKPMIVLPLFWDQYDNAQRVQECGFGVRLASYSFSPEQLRESMRSLLGDHEPLQRLKVASARIREADGVGRAAQLIEDA